MCVPCGGRNWARLQVVICCSACGAAAVAGDQGMAPVACAAVAQSSGQGKPCGWNVGSKPGTARAEARACAGCRRCSHVVALPSHALGRKAGSDERLRADARGRRSVEAGPSRRLQPHAASDRRAAMESAVGRDRCSPGSTDWARPVRPQHQYTRQASRTDGPLSHAASTRRGSMPRGGALPVGWDGCVVPGMGWVCGSPQPRPPGHISLQHGWGGQSCLYKGKQPASE
jgi:hypothetical protein